MTPNGQLTWMRDLVSRYKRSIVIALVLGLITSGFSALLMFTSGYLISDTALAGTTLFSIMIPIACVQLFGIGRPLARYLERLVSHSWVLRITSDLRLALYRDFLDRSSDPARVRSAAQYLGLLSDDVDHLQNLYLRVVFPTVIALLVYAGTCIVFDLFSVPFAFLMLLILGVEVIALPLAALFATRLTVRNLKDAKSTESAKLTDDIFGSLDWVLSGRSAQTIDAHFEALENLRRRDAHVRFVQRAISLSQALTLGLVLCLIIVWSSGKFTGASADPNWIAAFALGFFPLLESFSLLPAAVSSFNGHEEAVRRLDGHLMWKPVESPTRRTPLEAANADNSAGISLSGVSYCYPHTAKDALSNVDLDIDAGQSIAILGRSGSGKSTLAGIIRASLNPDSGVALLTQNGATEPASADKVGFIGQSEHIFNRTVRENLKLGNDSASDEMLWNALRNVGLYDIVSSYEQGLDAVLGETGIGLSGGESHRLALARILVADYPVVVIDEPFAALDPETESQLLDVLLDTFADRTLIVITHHLARIERFDRVVFLEDGRIVLDGSPDDLNNESDYFRSLIALDRA